MKRTNFYMTAQVFLFVTLFTALNVDAQQWDRFRGPNGSGVSNGEIAPPETWSPTENCLLYTSPSPRDLSTSRMPSSA